nr:hypothetical protein [Tanacetum cinerariifolium]
TSSETSTEFMQCFLRLNGFLGAAAGTEEEQAKNFQWFKELFFLQFFPRAEQERLKREYHSIRQTDTETSTEFMSTLNHLMCIPFTDVAQVANAARNYEILHERDDDGAERPDKRQKSGDRHQPTTQQSSHRNHGNNNDRHGSDRRGGGDNHCNSNNNYSGNNNRSSGNGRDQRNRGFQQSRGPSEGYSFPVCTTCGRRHPGECRRAAGACFKCGQTGHLQKDCKKNTAASTFGQADKKPSASGRVFTIIEDHTTKTSGTIIGTLFIYGHAVFVLFDTGATHSVISSVFASCVTTTPTLLDHVLCISTPMKDFVFITHVYRDLPLQFDDKIRAINALPLGMCEFDIILNVFPDELSGIPPVREVEFSIELISGAEPISKASYRMAPIELKELKDQLQELLER